jgi:hypothetical protein
MNLFFGGAKVSEIFELASAFHKNWDWTISPEFHPAWRFYLL